MITSVSVARACFVKAKSSEGTTRSGRKDKKDQVSVDYAVGLVIISEAWPKPCEKAGSSPLVVMDLLTLTKEYGNAVAQKPEPTYRSGLRNCGWCSLWLL